jgi:preprotein translocase SecE subunit
MANFIKSALAELEHVVWPTHIETKKYFQAVVGIIIAMTLFTYILTVLFSNGIFGVRSLIHAPKSADLSGSPVISSEINPTLEVTSDTQVK